MAGPVENISMIRMKYHSDSVHHLRAVFFARDDLAFPGFDKFFKKQSCEKSDMDPGAQLMAFQNLRDGRVIFADIKKPEHDEWGNDLEAMQHTLQIEKNYNSALLGLTNIASKHNDVQVDLISKTGKYITVLKRVGFGL